MSEIKPTEIEQVKEFLLNLQTKIISMMETFDNVKFIEDRLRCSSYVESWRFKDFLGCYWRLSWSSFELICHFHWLPKSTQRGQNSSPTSYSPSHPLARR